MEYISSVLWEQGLRQTNEDAFCLQEVLVGKIPHGIAVVCDGIGGLSEGENASSMVAFSMRNLLNDLINTSKFGLYKKKVKSKISRKLYQLHKKIQMYGESNNIQIGKTCTFLYYYGKHYVICSVGDSRIYFGKQKLEQKTKDDVNRKGQVTRAIGMGKWHRLCFKFGKWKKGMCILLCSDGLYRQRKSFTGRAIMRAKTEEELKQILNAWYEKVKSLGEKDNITGILLKRI